MTTPTTLLNTAAIEKAIAKFIRSADFRDGLLNELSLDDFARVNPDDLFEQRFDARAETLGITGDEAALDALRDRMVDEEHEAIEADWERQRDREFAAIIKTVAQRVTRDVAMLADYPRYRFAYYDCCNWLARGFRLAYSALDYRAIPFENQVVIRYLASPH